MQTAHRISSPCYNCSRVKPLSLVNYLISHTICHGKERSRTVHLYLEALYSSYPYFGVLVISKFTILSYGYETPGVVFRWQKADKFRWRRRQFLHFSRCVTIITALLFTAAWLNQHTTTNSWRCGLSPGNHIDQKSDEARCQLSNWWAFSHPGNVRLISFHLKCTQKIYLVFFLWFIIDSENCENDRNGTGF